MEKYNSEYKQYILKTSKHINTLIMNIRLIVSAYWLLCVIGTFIVRYHNRKKNKYYKYIKEIIGSKTTLDKKILTYAAILFVVPPCMPFILIYLSYNGISKAIIKKREIRKCAQKAYGSSKLSKLDVDIQKGLSRTKYKLASMSLGEALYSGVFDVFKTFLADDVSTVIYGKKTIFGITNVIEYWKIWREKYVVTNEVHSCQVRICHYYSKACLYLDQMIVLFYFGEDKINKMLLMPRFTNPAVEMYDTMEYPFSYEKIKAGLTILNDTDYNSIVKENRIPCLHCGIESEKLDWYTINTNNGIHSYCGYITICPHCGKVIEYYPENIIMRYDKPLFSKEAPQQTDKSRELSATHNKYSDCAISFHDFLNNHISRKTDTRYVDEELLKYKSVRMKDGYCLGIHIACETDSSEEKSYFFAHKEGEDEHQDISNYISANVSAMGAWQVYLLETAPTVMPSFWHESHIKRTFILKDTDLKKTHIPSHLDLSELTVQNLLFPSVIETAYSDGSIAAEVYCCYWNDWKGLVREHAHITIEANGSVSFCYKDDNIVLYEYNCGIPF